MNREDTIVLARAVRNWNGAIGEVTLVWRPFYSKLGVEYRQVTNAGHDMSNDIPDQCVKSWLWVFIRPQFLLERDSYYITQPVIMEWRTIITVNAMRS
jgi:hypothetical protein